MLQTNALLSIIYSIKANVRELVNEPMKQLQQNWSSMENKIDDFLTERQVEMDDTWHNIEKRIKQ